ncbi:hypothetical protein FNV43_RR01138 [Rhamnella rubrinervis]|uniref:Mitochondrial outer membrane protein porin 4 n=1 Tax=Rhamnella rubrinervis TaxID=2594499 RepID=A0A8K0MS06_9ROSA|nr:hypothetical protein FNV43_RR01138 [Rhamnella rubrinervis]
MGSSPAPFSDIGKKAKDLLTKDYNFDQKFTLSVVGPTELVLYRSREEGELYELKETKNKLDLQLQVSTKVTVSNILPSTKAAVSFKIPDNKSGKLDIQYLHPHAAIDSSIGLNPTPLLELSGAFGSKDVSFGGEVGFNTSSSSFIKYSAGISWNKPDYSAALLLTDQGKALKTSYIHYVNAFHTVAAELTHRFSTYENTFTIGSSHVVDPLTVVKARLTNDGKVAMLYQKEWRPKSLITFSAEYDSKATNTAPKLGLALALKP